MDRLRKVHLCRVYALVAVMCNIIPLLLYGDALSKLSPLGVICTFELIVFLCSKFKCFHFFITYTSSQYKET